MKDDKNLETNYDNIIDFKVIDFDNLKELLNELKDLKNNIEENKDNQEYINKYGEKLLDNYDEIYSNFIKLQCKAICSLKEECITNEWMLMFNRDLIFTKHEMDKIENEMKIKSREWLMKNKDKFVNYPNCIIEPYANVSYSFNLDGEKSYEINFDENNLLITPAEDFNFETLEPNCNFDFEEYYDEDDDLEEDDFE